MKINRLRTVFRFARNLLGFAEVCRSEQKYTVLPLIFLNNLPNSAFREVY